MWGSAPVVSFYTEICCIIFSIMQSRAQHSEWYKNWKFHNSARMDAPITCHCSRRIIAMNNSACLQTCMKSTSNINKNQKSCLIDLLKLFVACLSWRILKHRLKHISDCHLLRTFESFQDTSETPTFTLLIKTNAQLHLKMLSYNFYFSKNLTDFRHMSRQPAKKFNPKFF